MKKFGSWPVYEKDEIAAVTSLLKNGKTHYWTNDDTIKFEKCFANFIGVNYCLGVSNGSTGLELALKALGIGKGDEVIVSCRSYIASADCVLNVNAKVVFADVEMDTLNISVDSIMNIITKKTKAIIAVHLSGVPCNLTSIMEISEKHNLFVIEDASQAHGATYFGKKVGSYGHIGIFSCSEDKIITTGGEGGVVCTNDSKLYRRLFSLRDHGKSYTLVRAPYSFNYKYVHETQGSNCRLTEIGAVIGRKKLEKIDNYIELRRNNAQRFRQKLKSGKYNFVKIYKGCNPSYYRLDLIFDEQISSECVRRITKIAMSRGLPINAGACPTLYKEKVFRNIDMYLPNAEKLTDKVISLKTHPTLSLDDIDTICIQLQSIIDSET